MNIFSSTVVAAVFGFGLFAAPAQAAQKAVLIGAGAYPYLDEDSQLYGPENDVRAMADFLEESWGFSTSDIHILIDGDATKRKILDTIRVKLASETQPGDRVIIYYSGHGSQVPDANGDEEDGLDETFVPTDFGKNGPREEDMLLDDEIGSALAALPGREVILIADSCHSGTINRDVTQSLASKGIDARSRFLPFTGVSSSLPAVRNEEPLGRDVSTHITLSAVMPNQLSWETGGSGIFTQYLIKGLGTGAADLNGNGRITTSELLSYIRPRTEEWCRGVPRCRELQFTPNMSPKDEAFILQPVAPPSQPVQTVSSDSNEDISDVLPAQEQQKISLSILPGNVHNIGDEVQFRITSSVDGYLTLFDLTAENELVLLFPTDEDRTHGKTGRIKGKSPLTVPDPSYGFTFEAQAPTGKGSLLAIVTEDQVDLESLIAPNGDYEPIADKMDFMKELAGRLNTVWTGDAANRSAHWISGYQDYEIRP